MIFKAFGRLMHRIGHPPHHALRFRTNLWMAWREVDSQYRGMEKLMNEARHGTAEFFKILLALTGLPRVYRALDRRRRHKPRLDDLDAHTQEAVRAFLSRLDTASLPPISRVILYGSRARGDHQHDSGVDIMLVVAGTMPDCNKQVAVYRDLEVLRWNAYADLKTPRGEITSFACWQDEFDEPDKQFNQDFYRNVLADGIDIMQPVSGQPI